MIISFGDTWVNLWPSAILVLAIILIVLRLRKRKSIYLFVFSLFSLYILFVIDKTIFPIHITDYDHGEFFHPNAGINLIPFYFGRSTISRIIYYQIIANIFLTIPFGFGLRFISRVRAKAFLWIPFAIGFGIELIQFIISLALGYLYRVIDINDVILNALGVIIGFGLYKIFSWVYLFLFDRLNFSTEGVTGFLNDVVKPRE